MKNDAEIIEKFLPRLTKHISNVGVLVFLGAVKREAKAEERQRIEKAIRAV